MGCTEKEYLEIKERTENRNAELEMLKLDIESEKKTREIQKNGEKELRRILCV